ncbi:MAG: hypothetical protein ACFBSE_06185 [Prochloraceae cyanobacterium]
MKGNLFDTPKSFISQETKENLANLKEVIQTSIDNPPTAEELQTAKDNFKAIFADGVVTLEEKAAIKVGIENSLDSLGITPTELKEIKTAAQEAIADSPFFGSSENIVGLGGKDLFLEIKNSEIPVISQFDLNYGLGSFASKLDPVFNNLEATNLQTIADIISNVEVNNFEPGFEFI